MIRKTISMPDSMGEWIAMRVGNGGYNNESEYFRDLVRRDQEEDIKRRALILRLAEAEQDLAQGRYRDLDGPEDIDRLFAEIDTESRKAG